MPTLQVDLREGFDGDSVSVRVDGREVYRREGVRTNYSVGLADRIEVDVPAGTVEVDVTLPDRGAAAHVTQEVRGPATLAFVLDPAGTLTGRVVEASPRDL